MQPSYKYLNSYFDKIFVLTLPALTERHKHVKTNLKGLDYEFFYGIDKNDVTMEELKNQNWYDNEVYRQYYKRPAEMLTGMLCCSIGHMKMYEHIVNNNINKALIMEDDVVPVSAALSKLPGIMAELPADWELFYLGYEKNEKNTFRNKLNKLFYSAFPNHAKLKVNRQFFKRYYPRQISENISEAGFHDCTHAYAVTQEAARKMLAYGHPIRFNADNLLSFMVNTGQLKGYISSSKFFTQLTAFINQIESLTGK